MSKANFKILALGLGEIEHTALRERLIDGLELVCCKFDDEDIWLKQFQEFVGVYFSWDGVTGNTHRALTRLRNKATANGIQLIILLPRAENDMVNLRRRAPADDWIDLEKESFKLESQLYSLVFDDYDNDRRDTAVRKEYDPGIQLPAAVPIESVMTRLRKSAELKSKTLASVQNLSREWVDQKTKDKHVVTLPLREPILYLRPQSGKAINLENDLKNMGFVRLHGTEKVLDVTRICRDRGICWLIIWYSEEFSKGIDIAHELTENREFSRYITTFVFPGESAVQAYLRNAGTVFHDSVAILPRNDPQFKYMVYKALASVTQTSTPIHNLFQFRRSWSMESTRSLPSDSEWVQFMRTMSEAAGEKRYWALADSVLYWLNRNEVAKAAKLNQELQSKYANHFDARMVGAAVLAKTEGTRAAAERLFLTAQEFKELLTSSRLFRIGQALGKWKEQAVLKLFLEFWNALDIAKDHHLWFVTAKYFENQGDLGLQKAFLYPAVAAAPMRGQYIAELARAMMKKKDMLRAAKFWQVAAEAHDMDRLSCMMEAAKCLCRHRQFRAARELLEPLVNSNAPSELKTLLAKIKKHDVAA